MKNPKVFLLICAYFSFSIFVFGQKPEGIIDNMEIEIREVFKEVKDHECDADQEGIFSYLSVQGQVGSALDLNGGKEEGWNNQIRFFSTCDKEATLQHVIASNATSGRLIIAPGFFGTADDVMEVHGRITIGTNYAPSDLPSGALLDDYRLFVNGGLLAKEIRVASPWADYVFNDDYKLRPLSEVRTFIDTNGHLPDVSSAEELETNGMNVAEITVQQQVKIEELFLYILDMEERLDKLEWENVALRKKGN